MYIDTIVLNSIPQISGECWRMASKTKKIMTLDCTIHKLTAVYVQMQTDVRAISKRHYLLKESQTKAYTNVSNK